MKKFLSIFVPVVVVGFFVLVFITTYSHSRSNDSNFPDSLAQTRMVKVSDANVALANSNIKDVASFTRETKLVAGVVDRNTPFSVDFLYEDAETGRTCTLPSIDGRAKYMDDGGYRDLLNAELINATLKRLWDEELKIGDNGNIRAVIVDWETTDLWGHKGYYSICDIDADGAWDYATKNKYSYSGMSFSSDSSGKISPYSFSCGIISLPALTGTETFRDLEKII